MAKSKKKKKRVDDFKKVKLKAGKKLKKQNETDTNFKSKKLTLMEQLKHSSQNLTTSAGGGPSSHRGNSLNELYSQLHHYNVNVRKDAVINLRDAVKSTAVAVAELSRLVENAMPLMSDINEKVRNGVLLLVKHFLPLINESNLAPHFNLLAAQIRCAMTHVDVGVKRFAFKVIDCILTYLPNLICQCWDFVHSILVSLPGYKLNKSTDILAASEQKIQSRTSKLRLLSLMSHSFLPVLIESQRRVHDDSLPDSKAFEISAFNSSAQFGFPVYRQTKRNCPPFIVPIVCDHLASGTFTTSVLDDPVNLALLYDRVLSFAHGLWLEVTANDATENEDASCAQSFTLSDLNIMNSVLEIYVLLFDHHTFLRNSADFADFAVDIGTKLAKFFTKKIFSRYLRLFPVQLKRMPDEQANKKVTGLTRKSKFEFAGKQKTNLMLTNFIFSAAALRKYTIDDQQTVSMANFLINFVDDSVNLSQVSCFVQILDLYSSYDSVNCRMFSHEEHLQIWASIVRRFGRLRPASKLIIYDRMVNLCEMVDSDLVPTLFSNVTILFDDPDLDLAQQRLLLKILQTKLVNGSAEMSIELKSKIDSLLTLALRSELQNEFFALLFYLCPFDLAHLKLIGIVASGQLVLHFRTSQILISAVSMGYSHISTIEHGNLVGFASFMISVILNSNLSSEKFVPAGVTSNMEFLNFDLAVDFTASKRFANLIVDNLNYFPQYLVASTLKKLLQTAVSSKNEFQVDICVNVLLICVEANRRNSEVLPDLDIFSHVLVTLLCAMIQNESRIEMASDVFMNFESILCKFASQLCQNVVSFVTQVNNAENVGMETRLQLLYRIILISNSDLVKESTRNALDKIAEIGKSVELENVISALRIAI